MNVKVRSEDEHMANYEALKQERSEIQQAAHTESYEALLKRQELFIRRRAHLRQERFCLEEHTQEISRRLNEIINDANHAAEMCEKITEGLFRCVEEG